MSTTPDGVRRELVKGCHILDQAGHTDLNHGQLSLRLGQSDRFIILGAAFGFDEADESSFVIVDSLGSKIAGEATVPSEWPIHGAIYRARQDVRSIVHSHPLNAIAFSSLATPLRPLSHDACPFMPDLKVFDKTTNTITTWDLADDLVDVLGFGNGALLRNHGIVTVGANVKRAVIFALMLDRACEIQIKAGHSKSLLFSNEDDVAEKNNYIFGDLAISTYWSYLGRKDKRTRQNA